METHNDDCYIENKRFALINYKCGNFYFSSNFDSGNLGRVELVKSYTGISLPDTAVHYEFNVWTVPDCYGTSNETPNRTWFHFSVHGGEFYQNAKINVKNLNRQSKLFSQGMTPVMKVGYNGAWHRIKDAPTYQNEEENFVISFIHRVQNHPNTQIFYAFTYPFSYRDCLNLLDRYDEKYQKSNDDINLLIKQIHKKVPIQSLLPNIDSSLKKQLPIANFSGSSLSSNITKELESLARKELQNEIYYHRELLIKSLEGRRIDLLTITSYHGIQNGREKKIEHLFLNSKPRCHSFKNKKVIFLSSRVHPGETPASFVLNGFLNLILDRKNPVSITLRRMYVFKIVPILNPDGVYHGYYRTDTLGQNLNRFYIETEMEYHPAIYAVKKIIKFYNSGVYTFPDKSDMKNVSQMSDDDQSKNNEIGEYEIKEVFLTAPNTSELTCSTSGAIEVLNVSTESTFRELVLNEINLRNSVSSDDENVLQPKKPPLQHIYTKKFSETKLTKKLSNKTSISASSSTASHRSISGDGKLKDNMIHTRTFMKSKVVNRRSAGVEAKSTNSNNQNVTNSPPVQFSKTIGGSNQNQNKGAKVKGQGVKTASASAIDKCFSTTNISEGGSHLFLYIDMHGHASKKGVFMYGNHFPNVAQAVDCMLLPKLMTINSQHFHFDACNFSEKNMYRKEKRDGLSKEGSGRVAIYKMTDLIRCYTLECNYNCGKYINILPSKNVFSKQAMNITPPKYTPSAYEEVGRALGPSILDLTNANPISRLPHSEYRTLQNIKSALRHDIDKSMASHSKPNTSNMSSKNSFKRRNPTKSLPNKMILSSNKETIKENYRDVSNKRNNAGNDVPACSSHNQSSIIAPFQSSQQQSKSSKLIANQSLNTLTSKSTVSKVTLSNAKLITKTLKKPCTYKTRSNTNFYGKKDSPISIMKKKSKIFVDSSNSPGVGSTSAVNVTSSSVIHKMDNQNDKIKNTNPAMKNKRSKILLKTISGAKNSSSNSTSTKLILKNTKDKLNQTLTSNILKIQIPKQQSAPNLLLHNGNVNLDTCDQQINSLNNDKSVALLNVLSLDEIHSTKSSAMLFSSKSCPLPDSSLTDEICNINASKLPRSFSSLLNFEENNVQDSIIFNRFDNGQIKRIFPEDENSLNSIDFNIQNEESTFPLRLDYKNLYIDDSISIQSTTMQSSSDNNDDSTISVDINTATNEITNNTEVNKPINTFSNCLNISLPNSNLIPPNDSFCDKNINFNSQNIDQQCNNIVDCINSNSNNNKVDNYNNEAKFSYKAYSSSNSASPQVATTSTASTSTSIRTKLSKRRLLRQHANRSVQKSLKSIKKTEKTLLYKRDNKVKTHRNIATTSRKKISTQCFGLSLENATKLQKKRSRGLDSITIKHKKNKIRGRRL